MKIEDTEYKADFIEILKEGNQLVINCCISHCGNTFYVNINDLKEILEK